jgi:DNA polymerase-3 subunit chi
MGHALFYHLTESPLEVTLPMLVGKSLAAGWRVAVRGPNLDRLTWLDELLWQGTATSFLPHGRSGGLHDAQQPVLLTAAAALPNAAECLMTIDGADVSVAEVAALQRVCILFDGHDPEALAQARQQWKSLTAAGAAAQYWAEDDGRWIKKAEK